MCSNLISGYLSPPFSCQEKTKSNQKEKEKKKIINKLVSSQTFIDIFTKETFGQAHVDGIGCFIHSDSRIINRSCVLECLLLNKYKKVRWKNITQLATKSHNHFETSSGYCFSFRQQAKIYKEAEELCFKDNLEYYGPYCFLNIFFLMSLLIRNVDLQRRLIFTIKFLCRVKLRRYEIVLCMCHSPLICLLQGLFMYCFRFKPPIFAVNQEIELNPFDFFFFFFWVVELKLEVVIDDLFFAFFLSGYRGIFERVDFREI